MLNKGDAASWGVCKHCAQVFANLTVLILCDTLKRIPDPAAGSQSLLRVLCHISTVRFANISAGSTR